MKGWIVLGAVLVAWVRGWRPVWCRKIPHLSQLDVLLGLWRTFSRSNKRRIQEKAWGVEHTHVSLSVRTTFDALLSALKLEEGSEVIFSGVTIADMPEIARHHGLTVVAVDLDVGTAAPSVEAVRAAVTPRTKMVVLAHLFGARFDVAPFCADGLLVVEDCAECYEGLGGYMGCPESDVVMFSFGSIKTGSALGGSLSRFRDPALKYRVEEVENGYERRDKAYFFKRLLQYAALLWISYPAWRFGTLAHTLSWLSIDLDAFITSKVRGFSGSGDFFKLIRRRPTHALLSLLERRLDHSDEVEHYVGVRRRLGRALCRELAGSQVVVPGGEAAEHSFWLFPIMAGNPGVLIELLRRNGFDCTRGASQLAVVDRSCRNCFAIWYNLVYLPVYPEMPESEVLRMGRLIKEAGRAPTMDSSLREVRLARLRESQFDVLVVGGGINGAAVARDAAIRGLRVGLVEKVDYASGASGNSAKLIHGGFRYIEHMALGIVHESCSERDALLRREPRLVKPLGFLLPVYRNPMARISLGMWLYDMCSLWRTRFLHRRLSPDKVRQEEPLLEPAGLRGGFAYADAATDDTELTLENVMAAERCGACCVNHASYQDGKVTDELTGETFPVSAKHIVYATGASVGGEYVTPRKGTHVSVPHERLPVKNGTGFRAEDGRWCYAVPWKHLTIVGTTDTLHDAKSPVLPEREEVTYLLRSTNAAFPSVSLVQDDVVCAWAGLRPLIKPEISGDSSWLRSWRASKWNIFRASKTSTHTRGSRIFTKGNATYLGGGKLTPYRKLACTVVDTLAPGTPCVTDKVPLDMRAPNKWEMDPVEYAVRMQHAQTLEDVLVRRTEEFWLSADQGASVALSVAQRMAQLLGKDQNWVQQQVQDYSNYIQERMNWKKF